MNKQRVGLLWFSGSLAFALLSMLVPLPGALQPFKPYWPALFLLYWALEAGDQRVSLGLAFCIGLCADLLDGVLLGEQAMRLCALVFIALRFRSRLRFFPMWQQTLAVLALLLNDRVVLLIVRAFAGESFPPATWWISPFVGAALWPFLFLLMDDLRLRLRLQ
ncbi:rod shape-determining protein MreD [Dyella sp. SG562]|jgi:rod shape-determining protein MreD|uniref:rod shape-determining protein MreD n=1 Tax=Dyella TaxID=231454 RepID=UPI00141D845C|nr:MULTISPECIES: rod shape-determining protein MreD [unclassified Dyella]MBT2119853.1 rod shape-determining protein MreD [Dyella sp. LX-1]MBT2142362.1 rod shape-determining protein MreD [Dyella sp. LX-66]NII75839.1 rod shape-determining protein MreD [Dyella sp. SG562]NKJ23844.1 rod shape-determining protein MreD [Dyella sp. SG609]